MMNSDAHSEIAALRSQVFILLVATVVLSGTLTVYLFRQASSLSKEVNANQRIVTDFNRGTNAIASLFKELGAYGMTHPEIRPVLAKYGITPTANQALPPGAPGAPAAAAAPKAPLPAAPVPALPAPAAPKK